ncbi:MAG: hypothetical protein ACLFPE_00980 [Bacteroidales bacterium]
MEHQTTKLKKIVISGIVLAFIAWATSSCYYDNEEYLYPDPVSCDTTNVTYTGTVVPILEASCYSCHNSVTQQGGVIVDNYDDLSVSIDNGSFRGAINHMEGFSPMPQAGNQLPECDLTKINLWLDRGAPNN